jgi:hypothetical protein
MKINTSDKLIAYLALISGLSISAVAVYYSVAGLVSIFAAAAIPIMVMGVALEVSKLVATVWLKLNWGRAPKLIKTYLFIAITILMLITSMGIFGYLSKAHLDQAVPTGDVADKVALIDEKIKTQKENVDASRKALKQMDESVDQVMARSSDEKGADKAAALRRNQQKERANLQSDIGKAQKEIASLNEERAPIAKELRKVEAEVGPIKYIAALIYGDNPDQNILEKSVRWVIITIVMVFDPLAVILLLASQYSFMWFRQEEETEPEDRPVSISDFVPQPQEYVVDEVEPVQVEIPTELPKTSSAVTQEELDALFADKPLETFEYQILEDVDEEIHPDEGVVEEIHEDEDEEDPDDTAEIRAAKAAWKADNPHTTLKEQRRLMATGKIDRHPWEDYLEAKADTEEDEAAEEAAKWAQEQLDLKKKGSELDGESGLGASSENLGEVGYTQNAEQNPGTLWNKLKQAKE